MGRRPRSRVRTILWEMPAVVLAVALLLLAAALPLAFVYLPDAVLTLVRLCVIFCAALIAHATWRKNAPWSLVFAALGLLYNPVLTIHLRDDAWAMAHSAALLVFILHRTSMGAKHSREP